MPVYQELVDFDSMFHQLKTPPILVNDLINASEVEKDQIRDMIQVRYSGDMLSIMPSCQCGEKSGEHAVGVICDICNTVVKPVVGEDIEPIVWFRRPEGVTKLINPIVWVMLKNRFKKPGFNVLQWLCDTTYRPIAKQPKVINEIMALGIQRGYNNFVENFDNILTTLFNLKDFRLKGNKVDYLTLLISDKRDYIFSDYLPLPNKSLMVIEQTNVGIYIDPTILSALDAIQMVIGIDSAISEHALWVKENRAIKTISKLGEFYENFQKSNLSGKPGIYRKHVYGSRTHFSARAVVISITGQHDYDELYLPWGIGVTAFRPHLVNKLLRKGFEHNQAVGFLHGHVEQYHPLLDQLLQEIIVESPYGGIICVLQRNPSLLQGSAQRVRATKIKIDPADHTISTSILTVTAPNTDFDGR